jgi:hypothetical protein
VVVDPKVLEALQRAHAVRHALNLEIPSGRGVHYEDRAAALAEHAASILVPLLPPCAREALLGDVSGLPWFRPDEQEALNVQVVRGRAAAKSDRLCNAVLTLVFVGAFAEAMGVDPLSMWPMSKGMAALLISGEHKRATDAGAGARGGVTVGNNFRSSLKF